MNDGTNGSGPGHRASAGLNQDEIHSALFTQLVMQQSNLALMLLGKSPHPETGQPPRDLDAAKLFIDQLEMLEVKTKGNLKALESDLLKQSLTTLRLAFVEAVNAPACVAEGFPESGSGSPAASGVRTHDPDSIGNTPARRRPETPAPVAQRAAAPVKEDSAAAEDKTAPAEAAGAVSEEESKKRFSKKYSG